MNTKVRVYVLPDYVMVILILFAQLSNGDQIRDAEPFG